MSRERRLLVKTTKGMLKTQTEKEKKKVSMGGTGHGQDIVGGHGDVGHDDHPNGLPQGLGLFLGFFPGGPFYEQFHGNPEDDRSPDKFDELYLKQLGGEEGQNHPQDDRRPGSEDDPLLPLFAGQGTDGHGDDHSVVPGQDEIDEDDTQ
jgi:hypothetical protein